MSFESDLVSEDLQLSPVTTSEKYTDEEHSVISTIPEGEACHCFQDNCQEYAKLEETESNGAQHWIEKENPDECHHHDHEYHHHDHECPHHQHSYRYHHIPHWSTITMSDDDIEIITDPEYYKQFDDVFYIDPIVARSLLSEFLIQEPTPPNVHIHVDTRTKRQRFIARAVMIISMVMFTVSVLLVMISLIMSDHIDNLVRNANNLLTKGSTSQMTNQNTTITLVLANHTTSTRNSSDFG
ncbi:unnamed protein product [Mytilus edulis]|uniref:Uncharacterized protein n=1 Tax=Mytilus edulis TaxID=6550 RepID=A0A8S3SQY0_MYTED|nr:unnamed protein product [Mytilus edulis]